MTTTMQQERTIRPTARREGWLGRLVRTDGDGTLALLRVTLGLVMFPHAAQKMFGWFGGYGIEGTMGFLTGNVGLPALVAAAVIAFEFAGSLSLLSGLASRAGAAMIATVMVGAVVTTHLQNGFFMNWGGAQAGEGFEYHLLALAIAAVVMVKGSGALSVDRMLTRRSA